MDIANYKMFTKGQLHQQNQPLIVSQVIKKDQNLIIKIYDNCLTQYKNATQPIQSIIFNFDLKFSFSLTPPQITFERQDIKVTYKIQSETILQQWRNILSKKLNQRGFHEQFKPIKKIGKGNFASVYLAQKLEDKKSYAVKAFSKQAAYSEDKGKQCLIKEIQVMRHLSHKNTMKLHEVFQSQNSLYIIFELLQGGQLYDKIKMKYKFKPNQTQQIIKGILLGLKQMHSKNIMHRDLKPQNLLFRNEGDFDCVIADFGLAQFADISQYLFVRCGTPGYVAPEVINIKDMKSKYQPVCDIFSLGLIFHLLLLGRNAFPGTTYNQVLSQNRACNIHFTEDDTKKVGLEAMNLLEKMLKKNPVERISAEQALKHNYFKGNSLMVDENSQQIIEKKDTYQTIDSPLLTTANANRKQQNKGVKKDSCLELKMGKENMLTGKTQTVGTMGSKISGYDHSDLIKKSKLSAFCAEKK